MNIRSTRPTLKWAVALAACLAVAVVVSARAPETRQRTPASAQTMAPIKAVTPLPNDEAERVQKSIQVLTELTSAPDNEIPSNLLNDAEAVVVIPSLIKGGFIVGAKHGRGIISRHLRDRHAWSHPAFVTMTGGSIGWQIGAESIDLALLVMNQKGVDALLDDNFTLGGTLSVAAGPVGRSAEAATDAKLTSGILAYSRAQGLFAGATFEGAALHSDGESNDAVYGPESSVRSILTAPPATTSPAPISAWTDLLARVSMVRK